LTGLLYRDGVRSVLIGRRAEQIFRGPLSVTKRATENSGLLRQLCRHYKLKCRRTSPTCVGDTIYVKPKCPAQVSMQQTHREMKCAQNGTIWTL